MRPLMGILFIGVSLTACQSKQPLCSGLGQLKTKLYGAVARDIDWDTYQVECAGMRRPEGRGARLRLSGQADDDLALAIIIAIPDLRPDTPLAEFSANVTLIEEGNGRFFSTATLDNCLADIAALELLPESKSEYAIRGALYCVSPLSEINGSSSVSIPELQFSGLIDWNAS